MSASASTRRPSSSCAPNIVLLTCCLSVFVAGLDVTIVNMALPSIQRALHAPVSGLQWAIDAYTLVIACLLMFSGSLADRFGLGRLFVVTLLGPATAAVIEGPRHGWSSPLIIALFALAGASALGLAGVERRRAEPLVDIRFFRSPTFSGAALIALVALAGLGGFLFLNTLYLQDVRGYSPLHAGLLTIPMAAALAAFSTVSGRILAARCPRLALVFAGLLPAAGAGLLIGAGRETSVWYLVLDYLLFGAGSGLVGTPITNTALSGLPRDQAGVAGAIASTCRQTGAAIGVAVCGSIVAARPAGFVSASHAAWAVLAGCGGATALLGLLSTGRWARAHAERGGRPLSTQVMEVAR